MDIIRTIYKELFIIKLVHPGFDDPNGSEIFNQIKATPDVATQSLFNRLNMDYRCVDDSVICFIRSQLVSPPAREPKTPFVEVNIIEPIRFLLFASPSFLSKTYVTATGSTSVYYFTNTINNVQGTEAYLAKVVEAYNPTSNYDAGTIVNHAGEPFASLLPVNAADGIDISNTTYWKKVLPSQQVVNNADISPTATVQPGEKCFAVIDVFSSGTTNATYDLLNSSGHLLSPIYTIPFKSKV